MKHCFLCRWSFGATEYSGDDESPILPVLKCHPNGDIAKLKVATKICKYFNSDDIEGLHYGESDER